MYRAILPDGDIVCECYEQHDEGVEVYAEDGSMIAFVPYPNLVAVINQDVEMAPEPSVM